MNRKEMIGYEDEANDLPKMPLKLLSNGDRYFLTQVFRVVFYLAILMLAFVILSWVWEWAVGEMSFAVDRTNEVMPKAVTGLWFVFSAVVLLVLIWFLGRAFYEVNKS